MYPDATNSVDCFTQSCTEEEEFRKYWGAATFPASVRSSISPTPRRFCDLGNAARRECRMYKGGTGYGTGYHGYWVKTITQVNAHFGGWSDVEQFSAELHRWGMATCRTSH